LGRMLFMFGSILLVIILIMTYSLKEVTAGKQAVIL
jgi:hypothetical protein